MAEVIVALLALTPFIIGIPLIGKQLDVKHKTFDAARYAVWERTIWRSDGTGNRKGAEDIALEARDRTLGHPAAAMLTVASLRADGITENPLWRDGTNQQLIDYRADNAAVTLEQALRRTPVEVGYLLVPGIAYGSGPVSAIAAPLQVNDLRLSRDSLAHASIAVALRPVLAEASNRPTKLGIREARQQDPGHLVQKASAAILSDTWSARDENSLRRRVDDLTTNELIESLERPGKPIALQALGKGKPIYGEGQFAADIDLRVRSAAVPSAYIGRQ